MSNDPKLSDSARIAELEKVIRALELEKRSLETQMENLRADIIPTLFLTAEEKAMLQFCAKTGAMVRALELSEHLKISELRAHFFAENLVRRAALEKRVVSEDGEPEYAVTGFGTKILTTWAAREKSS